MRVTEENVNRVSAVIYTALSFGAALAFLAVTLAGDYDWVASVGGAVWMFLLLMIILMPTVPPLLRERAGLAGPSHDGHH